MNNKLYKLMNWPKIEGIIYSEDDRPHDLLGPHTAGSGTLLQTFQPGAKGVEVVIKGKKETYKMVMADEEGFFACLIPGTAGPLSGKDAGRYRYRITFKDKSVCEVRDAYGYQPQNMTDRDQEKFDAGIHYTIYNKLGAHPMTVNGVRGVLFAVWAPNLIRASVVGDFNRWDGRVHQMSRSGGSGIFELFIPDIGEGELYKFECKTRGGHVYMKADPYAFGQQLRPESASVVRETGNFHWEDDEWLAVRAPRQGMDAPISVYELHLNAFGKPQEEKEPEGREFLNYRELAPLVIHSIKETGYTHIELMPVMEHSKDDTLGYQTVGYYAPTARHGTAEDFMYFINEMHKAGIGVILDWVPAYFPGDAHGLSDFDGTCLYEHQDPRQGIHPDLGTLLYNYGRPQVSNYLIANALFWVERYHADGIRMDGVVSMLYLDYGKRDGEWIANLYGGNENLEAIEFLKHLNSIMKKRNPGILMLAGEAGAWPQTTGELDKGGLGFDLKWNTGWLKDYLRYISFDPYFRAHHHHELTFSMIYAYSEHFMLAFSHDEIMNGQAGLLAGMPGTVKDQAATLRLTYAYMMMHPGKKLLYMGQDMAKLQGPEEFDEEKDVDWRALKTLVRDLNHFYREHPALYAWDYEPRGFQWINSIASEQCMLSFVRTSGDEKEMLVIVANFANIEQEFTIGTAQEGKYKELLNTDAQEYGGGGRINSRVRTTAEKEADDAPYSFKMTAAPLSLSVFGYIPFTAEEYAGFCQKKEEAIKKQLELEKAAAEKKARDEKKAVEKRAREEKAAAEKRAADELEKLKNRNPN